MIRYVNCGWRSLIESPEIDPLRANWELLVVVKGRCAPHLLNEPEPTCRSHTLWLMPPQSYYRWVSTENRFWRAVFHLSTVPLIIHTHLPSTGYYELPLPEASVAKAVAWAQEMLPHFNSPDPTYELRSTRLIADLSLLIIQNQKMKSENALRLNDLQRVQFAENYYAQHMGDNPGTEDIASRTNLSARQLRRLFQEIRKASPCEVFCMIRLQRACLLLANTTLTNDVIAEKTGFGSTVDFYRAFRKRFGVTPFHWRTETKVSKHSQETFFLKKNNAK